MTAAVCLALTGFSASQSRCGKPATVLVTISGTTPAFDCVERPTCAACAEIDRRIVSKYFAVSGRFSAAPMGNAGGDDAGR